MTVILLHANKPIRGQQRSDDAHGGTDDGDPPNDLLLFGVEEDGVIDASVHDPEVTAVPCFEPVDCRAW